MSICQYYTKKVNRSIGKDHLAVMAAKKFGATAMLEDISTATPNASGSSDTGVPAAGW